MRTREARLTAVFVEPSLRYRLLLLFGLGHYIVMLDGQRLIKIVDGTMKEQPGQQCRTASTSANLLQSQLEDRIEHLVRK